MTKKIIIEVRVNEYAMREVNPHVPWTAAELARDAEEIREAGAAIMHFHVRRPDGSPAHDPELYADAVSQIRTRTDLLLNPTLGQINVAGEDARIAHIVALARDPALKPDFAPLDTGSTNIDRYDPEHGGFVTGDKVYVNAIGTLQRFAATLRKHGIKEALYAWTVPFMRAAEVFVRESIVTAPAYQTFVLTEGGILGGHPGTVAGLDAFLNLMSPDLPMEWSVCCKEGDCLSVASAAIERGGHVAIGIGDYAYAELGAPRNAELVRRIVTMARAAGREPATPAEVRQMLGMT